MSQPIPHTNTTHEVKRSLSQEIVIDLINENNNQTKYYEKKEKDQQNYINELKYSDRFIDEYNRMLDDLAESESQNIEKYPDSQDFWDGSVEYLAFKFEQVFGYPPDFTDYQ